MANELESHKQTIRNLELRIEKLTKSLKEATTGISQEIKKRLDVEEALKQSEKRLNSIQTVVPDVVYRLDKNGRITFINDAIRHFGYSPEELLGTSIMDLIHEEDRPKAMYRINERRTGSRKTNFLELRIKKKNHVTISYDVFPKWTEVLPTVMISAEGLYTSDEPIAEEFLGTQGIARDITDRKLAAAELYQAMDHLRAVLDAVPGYISWVSIDAKYIGVNRHLAESLNRSPEFFVGKDVGFFENDSSFSDFTRDFLKSSENEAQKEIQIKHFEESRTCLVVARKYLHNLAAVFVGIDISDLKVAQEELASQHLKLEDIVKKRTEELSEANKKLQTEITQRKKMEQELIKIQKLESIGVLAGGIAHDFNNNLTAILGSISVARQRLNCDDPVQVLLKQAEIASYQARQLTQQLLTFSKGGKPVKKVIDLKQLIPESVLLAVMGSSVETIFHIDSDLLCIEADEGQIHQVINNIVINGIQAMPEGGEMTIEAKNVSILPETFWQMEPGNYVEISFSDEGMGIPEKFLSKVFDPYFTTKQKGSGLGLATSYSILKKHHGHIIVDSNLGEGTTFTFFLPASNQPHFNTEPVPSVIHGQGKILLLDDEKVVREVAEIILEELGYSVTSVCEGQKAVDVYLKHLKIDEPFDAVIMDLTIRGGMGGITAVKLILEADPDAKVIVSSGYSNDPVLADPEKYGFMGMIAKPYELEEVGRKLKEILE